ncbi:hypothetical protein K445DRAFT_9101 [Daldinia sp. EC12]|nr:hypothetical protein K445DRAFT_9101 [Daldinia sp. EC12]
MSAQDGRVVCPICQTSVMKLREHTRTIHIGRQCHLPNCNVTTQSDTELRRHIDQAHPSVEDPVTHKVPCGWPGCGKQFEVATGARRCLYHHTYDAQAASAAPAAALVNQVPPPPPVPAAAPLVPVMAPVQATAPLQAPAPVQAPVQVQHQAADQLIDAAGPTLTSVSQQLDQIKVLLTDGFGALHKGNYCFSRSFHQP